MPCMPRPDNKATKIAEAVLGVSSNKKKKRKERVADKEQIVSEEGRQG